jgi:hypothetical protein
MYLILYRNKIAVSPSESWSVMSGEIYFDKRKCVSDVDNLNHHNETFIYKAVQLKDVK